MELKLIKLVFFKLIRMSYEKLDVTFESLKHE